MIQKPLDEIKKSDIEALIQNQAREGRTIEYKRSLPGNSDDDKREFLADISSFANAGGGDILYGITEIDGLPQEICGLNCNLDAEMLRLENVYRNGLDPRVPGVRMRPIDGFLQGPVLLIRIPRSWASPHMVVLKNLSRFFTRHNAGKSQMDVTEIRSAFFLSEALPEKIKRFRDERIGRIISNETPIRLCGGPKLIIHILPIASFMANFSIDFSVLKERANHKLQPIASDYYNQRVNLDGYATYTGSSDVESRAYTQIFRSGQIEAVTAEIAAEHNGDKFIYYFDKEIAEAASSYFSILKALEVPCPFFFFLSFTGVAGMHMHMGTFRFSGKPVVIDRENLTIPEVLIMEYPPPSKMDEVARLLRPAFDAFWNACGYERSYNFDEKGNWKPRS